MFEYEVEIDKPLDEVYAAWSKPENLPRWLTGLQRTELLSGEPGQVGAKTRQVYLERGRIVEMIETITAMEPKKHQEGVLEVQGMKATLHVDFIDRGAKTGVRFRSDFESKSIMMRLMMPFMKRQIRKRQLGDLERFGAMVESGELTG